MSTGDILVWTAPKKSKHVWDAKIFSGRSVYFSLTPIDVAQTEMLARTSPNIYDVLIAFFGGLAGIVAIASKMKGNVIPGVAIATALMPPLCTAGYGLATFQMEFFLGAFYLFFINTVFISLATLLTARILKFPQKENLDDKITKRTNRVILIITTLTNCKLLNSYA